MSMKEYIRSPLGFSSPRTSSKKPPLEGGSGSCLGSPNRGMMSGSSFSGTPTPMIPSLDLAEDRSHDYIIMGEFHEVHGPISIWIIPGDIELDQVALQKNLSRMMSVDYLVKKDAVTTFKEDTSNVFSNLDTGITYYAHHFTLLDVQARGFVRPLTLAYFTDSSELIMSHYTELNKAFSGVTSFLKRHNKAIVERDFAQFIETGEILETSTEYKIYEALKKETITVDFPEPYLPSIESTMPQRLEVLKKKSYSNPLRDITGLCGTSAVTIAKKLLTAALERFSQDAEALLIQENFIEANTQQCFRPELELRVGKTMKLGFYAELPRGGEANSATPASSQLKVTLKRLEGAGRRKNPGEYVENPTILDSRRGFLEVAAAKDMESLSEYSKDEGIVGASKLPPLVLGGVSLEVDSNSPWLGRDIMDGYNDLRKILHFPKKAPFARHVVFSLLKGRPVLVRGRKENREQIEHYVNLLSAFVPGYSQAAVAPWIDTPLKAAQMGKLRLVGVPTSVFVPYAIGRYSTVLNIDDPPSLTAPECLEECTYVTEILPQGRTWLNDESYLAHVQEVACKIAIRAFVYYHVCCVRNGDAAILAQNVVPLKLEEEERVDPRLFAKEIGEVLLKEYDSGKQECSPKPMGIRERMKVKEKFKKAFEMSGQDFEIIENFAEVIKMRQYEEFGPSGSVPQMRLDLSPVTTFDGLGSTKRQKPRK